MQGIRWDCLGGTLAQIVGAQLKSVATLPDTMDIKSFALASPARNVVANGAAICDKRQAKTSCNTAPASFGIVLKIIWC